MKKLILTILFLLLLPSILAIDLKIKKTGSNEVIIEELNQPATFDLRIENLGASGDFEFYNLLGFDMSPKKVNITNGETKDVQLKIYPRDDLNYRGFYTFEYFIKDQNGGQIPEKLTMNLINLKDAFETGSGEVLPEANSINIYISNKVNFNFNNMDVKFSSAFFDLEKNLSLNPYEKKSFEIMLNKDDFKKLTAGFYTLNANVEVDGEKAKVEGIIKFVEKDELTTTKNDYGFIINTQIIKKANEGNIVADSETVIKKNIISRLFTSFSPEPDVVERNGFVVYYNWNKKILPGESFEITVRTNWLFPLLIVFFIVVIVLMTKQYSKTHLVLRKKISFVSAKGGEFALKVSIFVDAKKHVERVNIIDRLPPLVKIYERFGGERPVRINEKSRKIEWEFPYLEAGEKRIVSYLIYSKVGVMGKFALPEAAAIYEVDGEINESSSNTAYFVAEQRKKDIED